MPMRPDGAEKQAFTVLCDDHAERCRIGSDA
jgi:hypothetical protein